MITSKIKRTRIVPVFVQQLLAPAIGPQPTLAPATGYPTINNLLNGFVSVKLLFTWLMYAGGVWKNWTFVPSHLHFS
ncbi:hypothetical protein BBD42_20825 [Paenibacillus sp. BIHB 4019]|uniref:Uncharacterized protein n=1 Tax=Paenibacillus sp. BIHB 4019 TaxID=1870819 RepID=A0A1B2DLR5_9BACL|nr:hypothetical protein BBD42_20825 [Paenibacillus sp. BIHB 4019]